MTPVSVGAPSLTAAQLQELRQAEGLMRETLIPPGVMGRDIVNVKVTPKDWASHTFQAEGEIAKNNMYGERGLFHFSGLVSLKDKVVGALKETFEHAIPR